MFILIFLFYFFVNSIHFLEIIKVCLTPNQHDLFYLTRMNILKSSYLFTSADAGLNYWSFAIFIIRFTIFFLLNNPIYITLSLSVPSAQVFQTTLQNVLYYLYDRTCVRIYIYVHDYLFLQLINF